MALLAAAIIVLLLLLPSEPSYQGQPISKWFYRQRTFTLSPDPDSDRAVFRAMGGRSVPFLVRRLEDAPSAKLTDLLAKVSSTGSEFYRQRKMIWQARAAYLLGEMGAEARSAEANLSKAAVSGDRGLRQAATVALMKIRHQPPDSLIQKLKDTSDWQAWGDNAIMAAQFGALAESAVPILFGALENTNNLIQAQSLVALGMIAQQPDQCIPAILPFLTSPNVSDRQRAMGALLSFGTNALRARKAIQAALTDSDPWIRQQAEIANKTLERTESSEERSKSVEPNGAANVSQPLRSETDGPSSAAGSSR